MRVVCGAESAQPQDPGQTTLLLFHLFGWPALRSQKCAFVRNAQFKLPESNEQAQDRGETTTHMFPSSVAARWTPNMKLLRFKCNTTITYYRCSFSFVSTLRSMASTQTPSVQICRRRISGRYFVNFMNFPTDVSILAEADATDGMSVQL